MTDIRHGFSGVPVLRDVTLTLHAGEIHALLGQNGAGKSTLMKVLGGLYPTYGGTIAIDGEAVQVSSPRTAMEHGIAVIYQELSLVGSLTVGENILLGIEPGRAVYTRRPTVQRAAEVCSAIPLLAELPFRRDVEELNPGVQQRVEIAKALAHNARILVMDEPTARLSGPERDRLHELIRSVAANGTTVIYISHFLEEALDVADSVTVMRNGEVVMQTSMAGQTVGTLTEAMLGSQVEEIEEEIARESQHETTGAPVVSLKDAHGGSLHGVSVELRGGEVVGLAGLVGSGRSTLMRAFVGASRLTSGTILIDGRQARIASPRIALAHGIAMVPESRKTEGIFGIASARDNMLTMAISDRLSRWGIIRGRATRSVVASTFTDLQIRPANPGLSADRFSGGNQQKLLFGRVLLANPRVVLADQPTAGVDVGTKAQIARLIRDLAAGGTSVLVASDDVDELLTLSDRILIVRAGTVIAEHARSSITRADLVESIAGGEIG